MYSTWWLLPVIEVAVDTYLGSAEKHYGQSTTTIAAFVVASTDVVEVLDSIRWEVRIGSTHNSIRPTGPRRSFCLEPDSGILLRICLTGFAGLIEVTIKNTPTKVEIFFMAGRSG
jgi:hypothetical protein